MYTAREKESEKLRAVSRDAMSGLPPPRKQKKKFVLIARMLYTHFGCAGCLGYASDNNNVCLNYIEISLFMSTQIRWHTFLFTE